MLDLYLLKNASASMARKMDHMANSINIPSTFKAPKRSLYGNTNLKTSDRMVSADAPLSKIGASSGFSMLHDKAAKSYQANISPMPSKTNMSGADRPAPRYALGKVATGTNNTGMQMLQQDDQPMINQTQFPSPLMPKMNNTMMAGRIGIDHSVADPAQYSSAMSSGLSAMNGFNQTTQTRHTPGITNQLRC